jgi:hypothetical protein
MLPRKEPYDAFRADLWSMGVVILDLLEVHPNVIPSYKGSIINRIFVFSGVTVEEI